MSLPWRLNNPYASETDSPPPIASFSYAPAESSAVVRGTDLQHGTVLPMEERHLDKWRRAGMADMDHEIELKRPPYSHVRLAQVGRGDTDAKHALSRCLREG